MHLKKPAALLLAAVSACVLLTGCTRYEGTVLTEEQVFAELPDSGAWQRIKSVDNVKYAIYEDHAAVIGYDGLFNESSFTFPKTVEELPLTEINNLSSFTPNTLTSVSISEGVVSIGEGAFRNCTSLESVNFPSTVTHIGVDAFKGTAWLRQNDDTLVIVNSILIDGSKASGDVDIPRSVTYINEAAFLNNKDITSVVIPASVYRIGKDAFSGCKSMESLKFGMNASLRVIGESAFKRTAITSLKLPAKLETIEAGAFNDCGSLARVDFPGSLTKIGNEAFYGCALTEIEFPRRVAVIGNKAFFNCKSMQTATVFNGDCSFSSNSFPINSDFVLYSRKDSAVQRFAEQNEIPFTAY